MHCKYLDKYTQWRVDMFISVMLCEKTCNYKGKQLL